MALLSTAIVPNAAPAPRSPQQVRRELQALLDAGARIDCAGRARARPEKLLKQGYLPRHRIDLFGTRFYVTGPRQNPLLRFVVAYVVPGAASPARTRVYPRIFYKDISLIWRSASHVVSCPGELWIGKGDVQVVQRAGWEVTETLESTTDLPMELQDALEACVRDAKRIPHDEEILRQVLHNAPPHRIRPYADFTGPRRRAAALRANLINGGKRVAYFTRKSDPRSLRFVPGFEPDFRRGILEVTPLSSSTYGGALDRYRILSRNRQIQYLFCASKSHVWIIPPQSLTTELSSYGLRTIDVAIDEDLCLPGFEYHFHEFEDDPASLHSQIPHGFAGAPNAIDPDRADASAWIDELPVVKRFRREVLEKRRG
jgi:hypothetical protein